MKLPKVIFAFLLPLIAVACGQKGDEEQVSEVADKFASAYFNYDFKTASALSTPESQRWLRFAASNVYEDDLEALRSMEGGAEVELAEVESLGDTLATVVVKVDNYLQRDTIGRPGHVVDGQTYRFDLVKRGGKWLVRLARIPRVRD